MTSQNDKHQIAKLNLVTSKNPFS